MKRSFLLLSTLTCVLFAPALAYADPITYSFNQQAGTVNGTGTITTDGTLGILSQANITAFTVTLSSGSKSVTNDATGSFLLKGSDLTATDSGLFFNFSGADSGFLALFANSTKNAYGQMGNNFCFVSALITCARYGSGIDSDLNGIYDFEESAAITGTQQIAVATPLALAATPEPSSLALLSTGVIGIATAMRKRLRRTRAS